MHLRSTSTSQGVELVSEDGRSLISDVFIAGIPYPRPTEYQRLVESKIARRFEEKDIESALWLYRNVQAWVQIRQACGRSIRHPEDSATWWFADDRKVLTFKQSCLLVL